MLKKSLIHVRLMAWCNRFKHHKACKNIYKQRTEPSKKMAELMHGRRWEKRNMNTLYNAKIFVNFINVSCMIFRAQNVSILPEQNWLILLDQYVLSILVSNIFNVNIQTFRHRKLCMKTWRLGPKMFWYL